jgi:lipoprotein-anchoring transpeptidase ErfK/SrfK
VLTRFILLLLMLTVMPAAPAGDGEIWVLVDTRAMRLTVFQGDSVLRVYEDISIGRGGTTADKSKDDEKTPLGEYRIARIAKETPFHRFYGLDYPTPEQAQRALQAGVINERQYRRIRAAMRRGEAPPQDTPLGGYLGIHGVGAGDLRIHENFNWTNGCIALSNEQIDDMAQWIKIGTRVVVR